MKARFFLSALIFLSLSSLAQSVARGYVFDDVNANSKKDRKEKGIAGVAVSNGVDVVLTNAKGQYELPVANDNILFVIKPNGYSLPVNDKNLPVFYYIHKPSGSPASFRYKGSSPTGDLPASVDFALRKKEEKTSFTALLFGDPQPYTNEDMDWFARGIVAEVEGIKNVSFGLSLGDLVGDNLDLHNPYIDVVKKVGIPWFNLMGNHDMNYDATSDSLSDETYEANFGPANYSFNYGNVHFIILDDILYPDPRDGEGYWGGFRKSQLDFVENDLKFVDKNKLIVLAFHIPINASHNSYRLEDRQRLFNILKEFPHTLSISAHTHLQRNNFYSAEDGWQQANPHHEYNAGTTSGDWYSGELDEKGIPHSTMHDGTPKGYAFIRFHNNKYVIDYKAAGKPSSYQMELYAPKVIPTGGTSANIYANFFMGAANNIVECRIDNGEWRKMHHVVDADPSFMHLLHRWDFTENLMPGRRPSNAEKCTHLWRIGFPKGLGAGEHTIEVRATDMFNRTFTATKKFKAEQSAD